MDSKVVEGKPGGSNLAEGSPAEGSLAADRLADHIPAADRPVVNMAVAGKLAVGIRYAVPWLGFSYPPLLHLAHLQASVLDKGAVTPRSKLCL